ncbi:CoA transferase [Hoeflea sp. TYP-13]|uniref:CoA transferase n=1 Tax=Hoeflea sp. TYP-13 TaxID=3230023 RepID=UPI0034C5EB92
MTLPMFDEIQTAFPHTDDTATPHTVSAIGAGALPSWFEVTNLAVASIGIAGAKLARLIEPHLDGRPRIKIDRRLASLWFGMTLRPHGWEMPSPWDPIAGDYHTKDGWIRLHTNAPHHRAAALSVLGRHSDRAGLEPAVLKWESDDLEYAIVEAGGCAATMRDLTGWENHPQGSAVSEEPLILWQAHGSVDPKPHGFVTDRPLAGIRILDLTRVLAGPVAGRFLAAYGADVLRIDPPYWDEPGVIPEVTLGKRCAGLDLKDHDDRIAFERLLAGADVLLHGYRPDALINLGYDLETLRRINPAMIDTSLNAYGWSGPWSGRRGFDSLVQMSSGIADYGMKMSGADRPVPLPVQALDQATGYLLAAATLHALRDRMATGRISSARLSLAGVARLLCGTRRTDLAQAMPAETEDDADPRIERTAWGPARRVKFPLQITGIAPAWEHPAGMLRSAEPVW